MPNILREVRVLRQEGKLHNRLINRTRILLAISGILFVIVGYNVATRGTNVLYVLPLAGVGFLLGVFVFSHMNPIQWNEEQEVVEAGRMDALGYSVLGLYIVIEIGLRTYLHSALPASATALLLSGIFGMLFGRVVGTIIEIHRVYASSHAE